MAATAALASSAMDVDDENDLPSEEEELSNRLSAAHIGNERNSNTAIANKDEKDILNTSDSTEDDAPTPEGFFIDSDKNETTHHMHKNQQGTSSSKWMPSTPPPRTSFVDLSSNSCPARTSVVDHHRVISSRARPLFISSSSGALFPPTNVVDYQEIENESNLMVDDDDDDDDRYDDPATRAAAAIRALDQSTSTLYQMNNINQQQHHQQQQNHHRRDLSLIDEIGETDLSRQDTFHTSHSSSSSRIQRENNTNKSEEYIPISGPNETSSSSQSSQQQQQFPPRTFEAYPNPNNNDNNNNTIPQIYKFTPNTISGVLLTHLSKKFVPNHSQHTHGGSALAGFSALLLVTCANYMLGPMRDAAALAVGVSHIPALTLVSTVLALGSSVPVGWLFEAPDPRRRRVWKRMGLTRGETQGTSLALFYRVFAFLLLSYALGFKLVDKYGSGGSKGGGESTGGVEEEEEDESAIALIITFFIRLMIGMGIPVTNILTSCEQFANDILGMSTIIFSPTSILATLELYNGETIPSLFLHACSCVVNKFGKVIYIMFFLVVHLMKLHSLSLIWGVTTEAMEYEENAEQRRSEADERKKERTSSAGGLVMMGAGGGSPRKKDNSNNTHASSQHNSSGHTKPSKSALRLKRLGFVGFGGTLGGILGSVIASFAAHILHLSGLLIVAAILLEISANLSIELGRIMQRHWEEQMKYQSCGDLTSLASSESLAGQATVDSSMRKSISLGSMKRVASGSLSSGNLANLAQQQQQQQQNKELQQGSGEGGMTRARSMISLPNDDKAKVDNTNMIDDNSFKQRLLRGITTILRSRLLIAIFTYNALYASTSVLLSFQRAELVANRSSSGSSAVSNTAFLAKINTASSVAVFALQASGLGAYIANSCGQRGALALMPIIRLCGVILLCYWHLMSDGKPPDLILFLVIDEFTKVINFAIAKPVRENLWRGLSAEARYEAKPIVDTLANRWGGGSAAFLVSFISRITDLTGLGEVNENGERSIFGFPPVLLLCMVISVWWTAVSADVGNIRRKIDLELKKQQ